MGLAAGMWLILTHAPVPLDTAFTVDKVEYRVAAVVKRPNLKPHQAWLPREVRIPAAGGGDRSIGWVWQQDFDDHGVTVLYACEGPGRLGAVYTARQIRSFPAVKAKP